MGVTRGPGLVSVGRSLLLVVDLQTRLLEVMPAEDAPSLIRNLETLVRSAHYLDVPVVATRQNPDALGGLDARLDALLPPGTLRYDKTTFSCAGTPALLEVIRGLGRPQVVLAGIEAHICVLQTALDLMAAGFEVFVVADAVSSRAPRNSAAALARMGAHGVALPTTESVVLEWLRDAAHPWFKDILRFIK